MRSGQSGLLHAQTGSGKTLAVWGGVLLRAQDQVDACSGHQSTKAGLRALWITPMRALAADTAEALRTPMTELQVGWRLGVRTGDTLPSERSRQERAWPHALVTTPESLSQLLTRADVADLFAHLDAVVVDEWHELLGNKRGVQVQLALARLTTWRPDLLVWGLSATLGNQAEALAALLPCVPTAPEPALIQGRVDKSLVIDTLLPEAESRLSWAGRLGAPMVAQLAQELDQAGTALVFTNTRSQAEIWYQLLLEARPDWAGLVALHHGSLDADVRAWVEAGLKAGQLKAVVATSSLDLGVDFLPVERVIQVGSAKGVARLLQRAGRSGHAPGRTSRVTLVPTHTLELVEAAAARRAAQAGQVEERQAPHQPLDVLVQHLVTVALGGGFQADALFDEVRRAHSYRALTREAFDWCLDFAARGGDSLQAYPEYHRIAPDEQGVWRVAEHTQPGRLVARRHRLQVGTIVSDASMQVRYLNGPKLGSVEESFIARLKKGDCFVFAGRTLEFVRVQDMTAYVRRAEGRRPSVPRWQGGRMPLSSEMARAVMALLDEAAEDRAWHEPEMQAARDMLEAQARISRLPRSDRLLVERFTSREGHHLWLYPFAGRLAHQGLSAVLAWRLARHRPNTFSLAVNDYGLELLSAEPVPVDEASLRAALSPDHLLDDILASLNAAELARRRFREIARVAGLVFTGYPGAPKSTRQLQASSSLFYEVFQQYDAGNRLLSQAQEEVLSQELDVVRLREALTALQPRRIDLVDLRSPSPFSLPLMVERLRERLSTEKLSDRVARALKAMGAVPR